MRFGFKPAKTAQYDWHNWFAWFPVEVGSGGDGWVWLETVERKWHSGRIESGWLYRVPYVR